MKLLGKNEIDTVSGGVGERTAADRALRICDANNLPDSTKVTISVNNPGTIGISETKIGQNSTVEVQTTCGELRKAANG